MTNRLHPYTWTAKDLNALKEAALKVGHPEEGPTEAEAEAFASALPGKFKHIESAIYDRDMHRVHVKLRGNALALSVDMRQRKAKESESAEAHIEETQPQAQ